MLRRRTEILSKKGAEGVQLLVKQYIFPKPYILCENGMD